MRFDWYQATVETEPDHVIGELLQAFYLSSVEDCKPITPYEQGVAIVRGDRKLAECFWGGCNPLPHVRSTSEAAPEAAALLREKIPHRVTRFDVCEDFEAEDAWDRIAGMWVSTADEFRVALRHMGDFHRGEDGRTLYLGAPSSVVRARCYEKGKELGIDRPIVRAEVQCRPKAHARVQAASLEPVAAWGMSRWSKSLGEALTGLDLPRVPAGTLWKPSDVERARAALVRQYGRHVLDWADEVGGGDALVAIIRGLVEARDSHTPGYKPRK